MATAVLTSTSYVSWKKGNVYVYHLPKKNPYRSICGKKTPHKLPLDFINTDMKAMMCELCRANKKLTAPVKIG